jgi:hypothetical protein
MQCQTATAIMPYLPKQLGIALGCYVGILQADKAAAADLHAIAWLCGSSGDGTRCSSSACNHKSFLGFCSVFCMHALL